MCISIPARVISIQADQAELNILGSRRQASTLLVPEVKVGDYVLTGLGAIVQILDEDEAQAGLVLFQELMALELATGDDP